MQRRMILILFASLVLSGAAAILLYSCNRPANLERGAGDPKGLSMQAIDTLDAVAYRPADDPQNPYAKDYLDWDRWVFAHLKDWKTATSIEDNSPDFRFVTVYLDPDGFVVPQLEEERRKRELIKSGSDEKLDDLFKCMSVAAVGEMDTAMWSAMEEAIDRLVEPYLPPIPSWVASSLPKKAILLPEGYVAALDGLGSWDPAATKDSNCNCGPDGPSTDDLVPSPDGSMVLAHEPDHWYLYDPTGHLLGDGHMGWWLLMYCSKHGENWPSGRPSEIGLDGYSEWLDPETGEVLSAWGWDGEPTSVGVNPAPRDRHFFRTLSADQLMRLVEVRKSRASGGTNE